MMSVPELALYAALAYIYQWSSRAGSFWMIVARLPATLAHELSHLFAALLFSASPSGFSLWPRRNGDTWELGSVTCTNVRWWNAFPIGIAPVLFNFPLAWCLHLQDGIWFKLASFVFLAGAIPSWQDLKVSLSSLVGASMWLAVIIGGVSHAKMLSQVVLSLLSYVT